MKSYMMPIAMITGIILHKYMGGFSFLTPCLIALMLLFAYCDISFKTIRFTRCHLQLVIIQVFGSIGVYLLLVTVHPVIAQGAMICVLAPTATSAPVITGMLGGNVASLTAYSLLGNMTIIIMAPVVFAFTGEVNAASLIDSIWVVFRKVFILLFAPLFGALLLQKFLPVIHCEIRKAKSLPFYLWIAALVIITGKTVQFILDQENPDYIIEISVALAALVICVVQFLIGRGLGRVYGDTIAGGQGLGQKNTILAIWMAQTYLNPVSAIGPGAYVLWQNMVNSYQVWKKRKQM
ncbi:MAG: transporter [Prevotella sp.]|nr:transporter [Prevotella sp.]